jgi:hypothetical protein
MLSRSFAESAERDRARARAARAPYRRRAAELAAQDAMRRAIVGAAPGVERVVGSHRFDRLPTFAELSREARR